MTRNESSDQEAPRAVRDKQAMDGGVSCTAAVAGPGLRSEVGRSDVEGNALRNSAGIQRDIRLPLKARWIRPIIVKRRFRLICLNRRDAFPWRRLSREGEVFAD
jgi:hypothetical protein